MAEHRALLRILAIETSGVRGAVALAEGERLLVEQVLDPGRRHTQLLIPAIEKLLQQVSWKPADLELIAISIGPGSYTGLRVGLTCAKSLAYACSAQVIAVPTLEVIAENAPREAARISVLTDAQRGDVYRAEFRRPQSGAELEQVIPTGIVKAEQWAAELIKGTLVLGPGLRKFRDRVPAHCRTLAEETWDPQVAVVARLAWRDWCRGRRDDPWSLHPLYLRKSAAEERAESKRSGESPPTQS